MVVTCSSSATLLIYLVMCDEWLWICIFGYWQHELPSRVVACDLLHHSNCLRSFRKPPVPYIISRTSSPTLCSSKRELTLTTSPAVLRTSEPLPLFLGRVTKKCGQLPLSPKTWCPWVCLVLGPGLPYYSSLLLGTSACALCSGFAELTSCAAVFLTASPFLAWPIKMRMKFYGSRVFMSFRHFLRLLSIWVD